MDIFIQLLTVQSIESLPDLFEEDDGGEITQFSNYQRRFHTVHVKMEYFYHGMTVISG